MDNIRDFILPTAVEETNAETALVPKRKSDVDYSVVFATGPDFAIRRKTKLSSKVFVFLVSQSQYYFKDEKKGSIEDYSSGGYVRFMSDCAEYFVLEEESGSRCSWLQQLERGKAFGDALASMIRKFNMDEDLRSAALHDWLYLDENSLCRYSGSRISCHIAPPETVVRKVLTVCEEYAPKDNVKQAFSDLALFGGMSVSKAGSAICSLLQRYSFGYRAPAMTETLPKSTAELLMDEYGLSGLEEILREYFQVGIETFPTYKNLVDLFYVTEIHTKYDTVPRLVGQEKRRFQLKEFKHYLWYQSVFQGYADNISNFLNSWVDTLRMQEMIYGKITEKYPEHLASSEKKLAFKFNQLKQAIDEARWNEMVAGMTRMEYKGKTYSMLCPKTPADVVDEAQQQSNCVTSYIQSIICGECMIFFCRYTKTPERSLVTVEIRADGSLGQVKARFNREPSPDVYEFVDTWYSDVVLKSDLWQQAA